MIYSWNWNAFGEKYGKLHNRHRNELMCFHLFVLFIVHVLSHKRIEIVHRKSKEKRNIRRHSKEYGNQKIVLWTSICAFGVYASSINKLDIVFTDRMYSTAFVVGGASAAAVAFVAVVVFFVVVFVLLHIFFSLRYQRHIELYCYACAFSVHITRQRRCFCNFFL